MRDWSLGHLGNAALLRDLKKLAAQDCVHLANLLAHIAEVDARQLWRDAGYPKMFEYCLRELHYSEGAAAKRLQAARAARRVQRIYEAVADGRIHLSGIVTLAPRLTPENAEELLEAATHKTREEIEKLIADRFPRPDVPERVRAVPSGPSDVSPHAEQAVETLELTLGSAETVSPATPGSPAPDGAREAPTASTDSPRMQPATSQSPGTLQTETPRSRVAPLSPQKYSVQVTIDESTFELLRRAQDLLVFQVPRREIAPVLHRALELLVRDLERRKFAATNKPRPAKRPKSPHTITAEVMREVWERDQGQCAFVNDDGRRCPSRSGLEYEHVRAQARAKSEGMTTTITADEVQLLCRAHNQLQAERVYGAEFMRHKRETAQARRAAGKDARAS